MLQSNPMSMLPEPTRFYSQSDEVEPPLHSYMQKHKIYDGRDRIHYITSHERQEHLIATYDTAHAVNSYWDQLIKDANAAYRYYSGPRSKGRCIEMLEIIYPLPYKEMVLHNAPALIEGMAEYIKSKTGCKVIIAAHESHNIKNIHIHALLSDRMLLDELVVHRASCNQYRDALNHRCKKADAVMGNGDLRDGYRYLKKGDVVWTQRFSSKEPLLQTPLFFESLHEMLAEWIQKNLPEVLTDSLSHVVWGEAVIMAVEEERCGVNRIKSKKNEEWTKLRACYQMRALLRAEAFQADTPAYDRYLLLKSARGFEAEILSLRKKLGYFSTEEDARAICEHNRYMRSLCRSVCSERANVNCCYRNIANLKKELEELEDAELSFGMNVAAVLGSKRAKRELKQIQARIKNTKGEIKNCQNEMSASLHLMINIKKEMAKERKVFIPFKLRAAVYRRTELASLALEKVKKSSMEKDSVDNRMEYRYSVTKGTADKMRCNQMPSEDVDCKKKSLDEQIAAASLCAKKVKSRYGENEDRQRQCQR